MKRNSLKIACGFLAAVGFYPFKIFPAFAIKASIKKSMYGVTPEEGKHMAKERILRQTDPYAILGILAPSSPETQANALEAAQASYNKLFAEFHPENNSKDKEEILTIIVERLEAALDAIQADPVNPTPIPASSKGTWTTTDVP